MLDTKFNIIFLAFNVLLLAVITFQYISLKNNNFDTLKSSPTSLLESPSPSPLPQISHSSLNEPDIPLNVFDADLYYSLYSDLQSAFGYNVNALNNHYWKYGIYEGRKMSYVFNVFYYYANYKDLQATTFPKFSDLYTHFFTVGIKEGRAGTDEFNVSYYKENNEDLKCMSNKEAVRHFVNYGINEGRPTSVNFDVNAYKNKYEDLRNAFGNDIKKYYKHYIMFGKNEGRNCK